MKESTPVDGHSIGGVSLASFLQMLEQERKNCTLKVASGKVSGSFFFEEGNLIDAECDDVVGQEAVDILLSLENPNFKVTEVEDRLHRITRPLAHLLLNAATRIDEKKHENRTLKRQNSPSGAADVQSTLTIKVQSNPAVKRVIESIVNIAGVKHYYLFNRQGKMITQSSKNKKIGDFITYCIVSGIQIRKSLDAKGLHRIRLVMDNNDVLLILPGVGMIVGLLLNENASIADVTANLRPVLVKQNCQ